MNMTTINDIAKLAKVSRTTVSRVLNNTGNVDPVVIERVKEVIKETGYVPSQYAKSLRTNKTKIIGIILPRLTTETVNRFLEIFARKIQEYGYQTIMYNTGLDSKKEIEAFSVLFSRRVDGIIHFATNTSPKLKETIINSKIPVIVVGQDFKIDSQIFIDEDYATSMLTKEFIDRGYNNIGFIGGPETDYSVGVERKAAFIATLKKYNKLIDEDIIDEANFDLKTGYDAMTRILEKNKPIDAVVAVTDRIAIGAMQCIHDHNLKIPEDIAIAGMGASAISFYVTPKLTTLDFKNEEQGELAVEMMIQLINSNNKATTKTKIIKPSLIIGDSI